jgi:hypothetical protein
VAASLPAALPKSLLSSLKPLLPAATAAKLTPALPSLPGDVPIGYTARTTVVAVVDQQTGLVVDTTEDQQIIANATVAGATVPLLPVMAVKVQLTPASVADLADKATSAGRLLLLIGVVAPLALAVIGLLLIVLAVIRRSPASSRTTAQPSSADPVPGAPDADAPSPAVEPAPAVAEPGVRVSDSAT